ncbi:MAG TPA: replication factor C large subunit, partial [Candidatus Methanoperedens sp.]
EDFIQWVDENLPLEYAKPDDLEKGYYYLSRASTYLGRVKRRQNYILWRYAGVLMTAGIVVARSNHYSGFVKFQPPSLWRKLGQTRGMRQVRDSTAKKIGIHCHVSMSYTRAHMFVFFRAMMKDDECAPLIAALLGLEPEEIAFLMEAKSVTKKVQKIYDEAQSMIERETGHEIELFGGFGARKEEKPGMKEETGKDIVKEVKSQSSLFDF